MSMNPINRPSEDARNKVPELAASRDRRGKGNLTTDRHDHAKGGEVGQSGTVVLACSIMGDHCQSKWEGVE